MVIEGEELSESQHSRPCLAACADPVTAQVQWQSWPGRQHRWVVLIGAGNATAGQAGPSVVLPNLKQRGQVPGRARLAIRMDSKCRARDPLPGCSALFALLLTSRWASWCTWV